MANYMAKLAEMLGVELGEEFKLNDGQEIKYNTYKFTEEGLMISGNKYLWLATKGTIADLLTGELSIVKLPWKPKRGERYYSFSGMFTVSALEWIGSTSDYLLLKNNMVFRTEEEALRERPRIYEEMTGRKWSDGEDTL